MMVYWARRRRGLKLRKLLRPAAKLEAYRQHSRTSKRSCGGVTESSLRFPHRSLYSAASCFREQHHDQVFDSKKALLLPVKKILAQGQRNLRPESLM